MSKPLLKELDCCPECGSTRLKHGRSPVGFVVGALFVLIGFVLCLATLGASFILSFWGVFMMMPHTRCKDCSWKSTDYQLRKRSTK